MMLTEENANLEAMSKQTEATDDLCDEVSELRLSVDSLREVVDRLTRVLMVKP